MKRTTRPEPVIPEPAREYFTDPYEWQDFSTGNWEEWRVCNFLRDHVMTLKDKMVLAAFNLTVEDTFNGRYGVDAEAYVHEFFKGINERLGHNFFRGYK